VEPIRSVLELTDRYDALLMDVWGVLHDGRTVFPGVLDTLAELRAAGTCIVLLSNVPRPGATVGRELAELGVPGEAWDALVTSGDVTRAELARRSPGPVHRLGRESDTSLWDGLGLAFASLGEARFVAMAGLHPGQSPDDYLPALRKARARDLELLVANPDLHVQHGTQVQWCPGAVGQRYAGLGGRVLQAGKPYAPIYERALAEVQRAAKRAVARPRILAIGDGIGTDIVGANRVGMDSVFVASGINGDALLGADGEVDLARAEAALQAAHARATFVQARFT
jgi:HAD superfamily hydrolase (TIGR01459 family)